MHQPRKVRKGNLATLALSSLEADKIMAVEKYARLGYSMGELNRASPEYGKAGRGINKHPQVKFEKPKV